MHRVNVIVDDLQIYRKKNFTHCHCFQIKAITHTVAAHKFSITLLIKIVVVNVDKAFQRSLTICMSMQQPFIGDIARELPIWKCTVYRRIAEYGNGKRLPNKSPRC